MATTLDMEQDLISMERKLPFLAKAAVGKSGENIVQELKAVAPIGVTRELVSNIKYESTGSNKGTVSSNAYNDGFNYAIMHEKLMWDNYYNPVSREYEKNKVYNSSSKHYFSRTVNDFIAKNKLGNIVKRKVEGFMRSLGFK